MESSASLGLLALSSWRWSSFSDQRRQRRRWTVIDGLLPDIVSLSSSCRENAAALHLVSSFNAGSILFPVHQSFQSSLEANWSSHSFFFSPWKSFPAFCVSFPFFLCNWILCYFGSTLVSQTKLFSFRWFQWLSPCLLCHSHSLVHKLMTVLPSSSSVEGVTEKTNQSLVQLTSLFQHKNLKDTVPLSFNDMSHQRQIHQLLLQSRKVKIPFNKLLDNTKEIDIVQF